MESLQRNNKESGAEATNDASADGPAETEAQISDDLLVSSPKNVTRVVSSTSTAVRRTVCQFSCFAN